MGLDFSMRTKAFIDELNTFVKEFRTKLFIEEDGADHEEAWSLLTAMLSAIFKTMSAARAEAGDKLEDDPDLDSRAAKVFWGTWQCYRVMAQLLQIGFRKHPCVLPALTLHSFARKVSLSKVNKMAAPLAILENPLRGALIMVSLKLLSTIFLPHCRASCQANQGVGDKVVTYVGWDGEVLGGRGGKWSFVG